MHIQWTKITKMIIVDFGPQNRGGLRSVSTDHGSHMQGPLKAEIPIGMDRNLLKKPPGFQDLKIPESMERNSRIFSMPSPWWIRLNDMPKMISWSGVTTIWRGWCQQNNEKEKSNYWTIRIYSWSLQSKRLRVLVLSALQGKPWPFGHHVPHHLDHKQKMWRGK